MTTEQRTSNLQPDSSRLSKQSCQSCKLRKRRCTRELPECRLCIRGRRSCSYQSIHHKENQQLHSEIDPSAAVSEQTPRNNFPVAFFLDPTLFNCCALLATSLCPLPIPPKIEDILGDINSKKALAAEYFKTANRWMPILSEIRFYGSLINPLRYADPGVTSILLGMKLLLSWPEEENLCSEIYVVAKEFLLRMEMAGHLSIYTIQSAILIAMYEMGHAIYPGAFTTVSTCARYAISLGINGTLPLQGKAWVEQEERNRTWWAILILDRSINLGFRGRHLCTPDPSANSILPVDDDAWDQGVLPENQSQNLLSTPSLKNGRYACLAQAVNLLSQVFRHISSREEALPLDLDNIAQLERTIFALEHLASFEEQERNICYLSSIAICYSSVLLLRTAYLSEPHEALTEEGKELSQHSIRQVLVKTLGHFQRFRDGWGSRDRFPPLALDWLYRSAVAHIFLAYDAKSSEWDKEIAELKEALEFVGQRWRVATHYLRLLETRQAVRIPL
ncbi:hypothetical protein N431DRAFT_400710 [Stipitochalara longipes BDJ]|nr:hypothetical protein N431DRAFT_400710 [Stipitochalara longipes BDJ]